MMMVDDDYHENLTPERVRQIVKGLRLMAAFEPVLTRNVGKPEALTLEGYRKRAATRGSPRRSRWSPTRSSRRSRSRACAGAAAPASPPA